MNTSRSKVILAIMDGYGLAPPSPTNAVTSANSPTLDHIFATFPTATLKTSGRDVGLPDGQMGNSEVGHLNIGAGRIVYQDITRIDRMIETGAFEQSTALHNLLQTLRDTNGRLHLLGLVSSGGVHSSLAHLRATLALCRKLNFQDVCIHAFTDGRDTPPHSGLNFVQELEAWNNVHGAGAIATVCGRYYAMDRDKRWDRVELAYKALCFGVGERSESAVAAIEKSYANSVTDEFILPTVLAKYAGQPLIRPQDGIFYFNFRADRTRQLTDALTQLDFTAFDAPVKVKHYVTMTRFREDYDFPIVSPPQSLSRILGHEVSQAGLKQFRIAETEKYPHVTFFFNGGEETPLPGEERRLIPSPKVATYDLQPEMSAPEVTELLCNAIASEQYAFIVVNFANCDMVGHTGVLQAAIKAVETVDKSVARMTQSAAKHGYAILLTADHGNAEQMWDPATNGPHTAHTTNLVPIALIGAGPNAKLRDGGRLADLAPTILELLGLPEPPDMTGESLLIR